MLEGNCGCWKTACEPKRTSCVICKRWRLVCYFSEPTARQVVLHIRSRARVRSLWSPSSHLSSKRIAAIALMVFSPTVWPSGNGWKGLTKLKLGKGPEGNAGDMLQSLAQRRRSLSPYHASYRWWSAWALSRTLLVQLGFFLLVKNPFQRGFCHLWKVNRAYLSANHSKPRWEQREMNELRTVNISRDQEFRNKGYQEGNEGRARIWRQSSPQRTTQIHVTKVLKTTGGSVTNAIDNLKVT